MGKRYPPKLKFQVVLELLKGDRTPNQVSRAYNVHPNSAGLWKRELLEKGPEIFSKDGVVAEYERRIAELEQLLGKKECRVADCEEREGSGDSPFKNFLGQNV